MAQTMENMNQLLLRSASMLESNNNCSRSVTKRNSGLAAAQSANLAGSTAMASTTTTCKLQTGKSSHATTIKPPRVKSKKPTGMKSATSHGQQQKWVTKESNGSQIRVRKVFMQNGHN